MDRSTASSRSRPQTRRLGLDTTGGRRRSRNRSQRQSRRLYRPDHGTDTVPTTSRPRPRQGHSTEHIPTTLPPTLTSTLLTTHRPRYRAHADTLPSHAEGRTVRTGHPPMHSTDWPAQSPVSRHVRVREPFRVRPGLQVKWSCEPKANFPSGSGDGLRPPPLGIPGSSHLVRAAGGRTCGVDVRWILNWVAGQVWGCGATVSAGTH